MADGRAYRARRAMAAAEIRRRIAAAWPGTRPSPKTPTPPRAPARRATSASTGGDGAGGPARRFGIISPMTEHFCDTCNRLRLSAAGALHACLALRRRRRSARPPARGRRGRGHRRDPARRSRGKRDGHTFELIGLGGPRKAMVQIGG